MDDESGISAAPIRPPRIVRKRLRLLRHAKSSWDEPGLDDHDRPLAPRGRRAAAAIAEHLQASRQRPELVVCSTASRARQTLEILIPVLDAADVEFEPALYHASLERLRRLVAALPDAVDDVLVIGHNPGLQELAADLALPGELRSRVEEKLPTGALATLEGPMDRWDELAGGGVTLASLVLPRELGVNGGR
jgi:phosphohistidine phosphatase